ESRKNGLPSGTWRGSAAHPLRISALTLLALLAKTATFVYFVCAALRLRLPLGARGIMAAALALRSRQHALDVILFYVSNCLWQNL
ncbi:MAG: hypothetical protein ABRQ26_15830, partial [Syntrophomonadaceae bacterium]